MFNSKTREGSKVFSRQAGAIELDQDNLPIGTQTGTNKIGAVTVDQLELGVGFPNVQSAINDLANLYQIPIGAVYTVVEDTSIADQTPKGVSMTERLTVVGTATADSKVISVYGIPVILEVGDNRAQISTKIVQTLTPYKNKNIAFNSVSLVSGQDNQIEVVFIDTNTHNNFNAIYDGITITGETITTAKQGYGTWTYIGESPIAEPFPIETAIKLKYYKRIA
jgi:hypothetical protein